MFQVIALHVLNFHCSLSEYLPQFRNTQEPTDHWLLSKFLGHCFFLNNNKKKKAKKNTTGNPHWCHRVHEIYLTSASEKNKYLLVLLGKTKLKSLEGSHCCAPEDNIPTSHNMFLDALQISKQHCADLHVLAKTCNEIKHNPSHYN